MHHRPKLVLQLAEGFRNVLQHLAGRNHLVHLQQKTVMCSRVSLIIANLAFLLYFELLLSMFKHCSFVVRNSNKAAKIKC